MFTTLTCLKTSNRATNTTHFSDSGKLSEILRSKHSLHRQINNSVSMETLRIILVVWQAFR